MKLIACTEPGHSPCGECDYRKAVEQPPSPRNAHPDELKGGDFHREGQDEVNHPTHYTKHPSGIECIEVSETLGFNLGNCFKYLFRRQLKSDPMVDLKKALWYAERETKRPDDSTEDLKWAPMRKPEAIAEWEPFHVGSAMMACASGDATLAASHIEAEIERLTRKQEP
jgi:hypothetical protein